MSTKSWREVSPLPRRTASPISIKMAPRPCFRSIPESMDFQVKTAEPERETRDDAEAN